MLRILIILCIWLRIRINLKSWIRIRIRIKWKAGSGSTSKWKGGDLRVSSWSIWGSKSGRTWLVGPGSALKWCGSAALPCKRARLCVVGRRLKTIILFVYSTKIVILQRSLVWSSLRVCSRVENKPEWNYDAIRKQAVDHHRHRHQVVAP